MPIYDYRCTTCEAEFELFLRKEGDAAKCPECGSDALEKQLSLPRLHTEGRKERSLKAAQKRDQKQSRENMMTQIEYEQSHDD